MIRILANAGARFFIYPDKNMCFSLYLLFWDTIGIPTQWRDDYEDQQIDKQGN